MRNLFIILFLSLSGFSTLAQDALSVGASASQDTARQVIENVMIYKDPRLDILDKRPPLIAKLEAEEKAREIPVYRAITSADGKKKVTGSIYTTKGFRVVIFNGPDRNLALATKNAFMRVFPNTPSYMSYNAPSYKIKVGNFKDRGEAAQFMRTIFKAFPTSFIVPDIVTIKNINVVN